MSVADWVQTQGIDLSHWNNFPSSLPGVDFIIVKATEGTTVDPSWASHYAKARASKTPIVAAYHFGRSDIDIAAQVDKFLATAPNADGYALDVENERIKLGDGTTKIIPKMTDAQAAAFIARMHSKGKRCLLYMSYSGYYRKVGQDGNWVAYYNPTPPPMPFDIWQNGPYPGLGVDGNLSPWTVAELQTLLKGTPKMTDIDVANSNPLLVDLPAGIKILNPDGTLRIASLGTARKDVFSPFATTSDGGTAMRAIVWTGAAAGGDILLAAYTSSVTNPRPFAPVADCTDAVAAAVAAQKTADAAACLDATKTAVDAAVQAERDRISGVLGI